MAMARMQRSVIAILWILLGLGLCLRTCIRQTRFAPLLLPCCSLSISLSWSSFSIDGQIYSTVEESGNYGTVGHRGEAGTSPPMRHELVPR